MSNSIKKIEYEVLISIDGNEGTKYYVYAHSGKEAINEAFKQLNEEFDGLEIKIKCVRKVKENE